MKRDFWTRVAVGGPDECWPWQGPVDRDGYGRESLPDVRVWIGAHRVAWYWTHGSLPPKGLVLDHLCRNRLCVNPAHLEVVTPRENTMRGDTPARRFSERTSCDNGHPLAGANLAIRRDGTRKCRRCHSDYMRAWRRSA